MKRAGTICVAWSEQKAMCWTQQRHHWSEESRGALHLHLINKLHDHKSSSHFPVKCVIKWFTRLLHYLNELVTEEARLVLNSFVDNKVMIMKTGGALWIPCTAAVMRTETKIKSGLLHKIQLGYFPYHISLTSYANLIGKKKVKCGNISRGLDSRQCLCCVTNIYIFKFIWICRANNKHSHISSYLLPSGASEGYCNIVTNKSLKWVSF